MFGRVNSWVTITLLHEHNTLEFCCGVLESSILRVASINGSDEVNYNTITGHTSLTHDSTLS